jgi:hypothetical protein
VLADLGRAAHFLGDRERALEHLLQGRAKGARTFGLAHRLFQLAEDLRLAEDHRVEPAGDAKRMPGGRGAFHHVGVRAQGLARHPADARQPVDGRAHHFRLGADVELGAVAGRDDRDLADPVMAGAERLQGGGKLLRREREAAAQVQRRGRVVEPQREDAHCPIIKFALSAQPRRLWPP